MLDLADARTDTLSSTLLNMRLHSMVSGATDAAGKWALQSPGFQGFLLYLVVKGEGWVMLRSTKRKYHLRPGDCFLMTSGEPYVATSDLSVTKYISIEQAIRSRKNGVITINGGGESFTIAINFQFQGNLPQMIFKGLPPAIHIPEHVEQAAILRANIERFRAEYLGRHIGHLLVLNHLAPIILVHIFRIYLSTEDARQNWLTSLSDPKLSRVIEAMHTKPGNLWSLESLAQLAGMSRAGFALSFKKKSELRPASI
jgi:AraC-like DNA-binding protein